MEELDGVRLAQGLVEPSLPPTATQEVSGSHIFAEFAVRCQCPTCLRHQHCSSVCVSVFRPAYAGLILATPASFRPHFTLLTSQVHFVHHVPVHEADLAQPTHLIRSACLQEINPEQEKGGGGSFNAGSGSDVLTFPRGAEIKVIIPKTMRWFGSRVWL